MRTISIIFGGLSAVALVVLGLWSWERAGTLANLADASSPERVEWAVRCGAIAIMAAAQGIVLTFVVDLVYRRDRFSDLARLSAVLVFAVGLIGAIALAVAGR